jgi:hypothetical protein
MNTQIFHLTLEGPDNDVTGCEYRPVKVTIEGGRLSWGEDDIKEFKQLLADYFDIYPKNIRTGEEEEKDAEELNKYIQSEINK